MKICKDCREKKLLREFNKSGRGRTRPECKECRNKLRRKDYADKINQGLCISCGLLALEGWRLCSKCLEKQTRTRKKREGNYKSKSICLNCGENHNSGGVYCSNCKEKKYTRRRETTRKRQENQECILCGNPIIHEDVGSVCRVCLDRNNQRRYELKVGVFKHYGLVCNICGEHRIEFLCIDHIEGGGNEHRRILGNGGFGDVIYRWLKKNNYPEGFQLLCYNCNIKKFRGTQSPEESSNRHPIVEDTKVCSYCGEALPVSNFSYIKKQKCYMSRCRICRNHIQKEKRNELKLEVMIKYGGQCQCCGEKDIDILSIDHINRNGSEHRRELFGDNSNTGGFKFYKWLSDNNYPKGFRVLCYNCNMAYGLFDYCPHNKEGNNDSSIVSRADFSGISGPRTL